MHFETGLQESALSRRDGVMKKTAKMILPFILAAIAPVAAFFGVLTVLGLLADSPEAAFSGFGTLVVVALAVSFAHVLILGVPSIWLLSKVRCLRFRPVVVAGFIAGCIPSAIWDWPFAMPRWSPVDAFPNGGLFSPVPSYEAMTFAGWVHYFYGVAVAGALGVVAAWVFWWFWERMVLN